MTWITMATVADRAHMAQTVMIKKVINCVVYSVVLVHIPRELIISWWAKITENYPAFDDVGVALQAGLFYLIKDNRVDINQLIQKKA